MKSFIMIRGIHLFWRDRCLIPKISNRIVRVFRCSCKINFSSLHRDKLIGICTKISKRSAWNRGLPRMSLIKFMLYLSARVKIWVCRETTWQIVFNKRQTAWTWKSSRSYRIHSTKYFRLSLWWIAKRSGFWKTEGSSTIRSKAAHLIEAASIETLQSYQNHRWLTLSLRNFRSIAPLSSWKTSINSNHQSSLMRQKQS